MICNSLIILKKWSMDTRLLKEECPKKMVSPPIVDTSNVVTPTVEKTNDGFQTIPYQKFKGAFGSRNLQDSDGIGI
ncbi:hypothetical protein Tco_1208727 [Tanacetum coccineum]